MKKKHFLSFPILVICVVFSSVLHAQEYKGTNLPFTSEGLTITTGGGFEDYTNEHGVVEPSCSGITLDALKLGDRDIPLKSTSVTSGCMIETKNYGNVLIKMNPATFACYILVTQKQEKAFRKLLAKPNH